MSTGMISKERVLAAFDHVEPDRVPRWLGASPRFREKALSYLGLADDESLSRLIKDDFRRITAEYDGPEQTAPYTNLPPGATFRSVFGILRHGYEGGQPMNHPLTGATTTAEIESYAWPDPAWMDISHSRADAARYCDDYAILGGDWSPFWHDAIDLMGMEKLLINMFDAPALVDALLTHIVDFYYEVSRRIFAETANQIDIFFIGNDFGSTNGPLIGEKQFRRFIVPHLKRLIDLGHQYDLKVLLHCCGGYAPLIPTMIEIGLDGLQALQPNCKGMEPSRLKAKFGNQITMMGCIDSQFVIEGTPETVRDETRRILDLMKPDGGYIACPSHDYVLEETPVENILALYQAVDEFGGYR